MAEPKEIGEIIDARGVKFTLEDDDFINDIVVIAEVIRDGDAFVAMCTSEGTTWVKQVGLLTIAKSSKLVGGERE